MEVGKPKSLSIIIPVYNERKTIKEIVKKVKNAPSLGLKKEIIIVDDGSNDGTANIVKKFESKNIKVFLHKKNKGKGAALRTGFKNATGDIFSTQDADLEYDPNEIKLLLEPILDSQADVVYGSRFVTNKPRRVLYFWHFLGNSFLTLLSNAFTDLNLTDMETGYKIFRREIIKRILPKLTSNRFGFEPEVTAYVSKLAKKYGYRVFEVGISYFGRTYQEGKKIGWKDGFQALWCIVKFNLFTKI